MLGYPSPGVFIFLRRSVLVGVPIEDESGRRKPLASSAAGDSPPHKTSAETPPDRPGALGDGVQAVVALGRLACDRATGDGHRVASARIRPVVGMEVTADRSATACARAGESH
jgi:hypothetical protein